MSPPEVASAGAGPAAPGASALFPPTRWSLVLAAAADADDGAADRALAELCAAYRRPVLGVLRGLRVPPEEVEDVAHAFLAWVLESRPLRRFERREARFRAFLTACLHHFLADWRRRAAGRREVSTGEVPEIPAATPDLAALLDAALAHELDARAQRALDHHAAAHGLVRELALLRSAPRGDLPHGALPGIAAELRLTHAAVRHRVRTWRGRYLDAFRREVVELVSPDLEADELRYLLALTVQEAGAA
jgi:DNA-directed RNA polymerase specialized sigma24 family protein